MLGQWVLNGNVKKSLKLNDLATQYELGMQKDNYVSLLIKAGVCPSEIPKEKLLKYCVIDVDLCHRVFIKQLDLLNDSFQLHLCLTRNLCCVVLADIEFAGMDLDKVRVIDEYNKIVTEKAQLDQRLAQIAAGVNLGSPKQLAEFLYDKLQFREPVDHKGKPIRTDTGKRSTDASTLDRLYPTTPEQREFLELYRRFNKVSSLLQKNLEFFKLVCDTVDDANFTAQFNQAVAGTHRLASSGRPMLFPKEKKPRSVQFQNLPRAYKRLFWAGDEDCMIGEVDGAALEFRVAADLGDDQVAIKEIETWEDIHKITADTLTRAGEPTDRQGAKASTFAPLYAGMGKTPAQKAYATFFKKKYKGISETQKSWAEKVVDNKELRTPYGMLFYWPNCRMTSRGYIEYSTEIYNYPVQGFATGEIIPIALVHFWYRCKSYDSGITIVNTVHDSIIAKFHKSKEEEFRSIATKSLTTDVYNYLDNNYHYNFKTPLGVGLKCSKHWGDTDNETKANVWPDGRIEYKESKKD